MAESDELAMSVLAAWPRVGLRIPEDLSVLGFDDQALAETFGLSTIAQPVAELGRQAAALAVQLAAGEQPPRRQIELPVSLLIRRSTAALVR